MEFIRQELRNLQAFRGVLGITQAAGVVVGTTPYQNRADEDRPKVIVGILLEYHVGGTLEDVLNSGTVDLYPWATWVLQLVSALKHMHDAGKTHGYQAYQHRDRRPGQCSVD